MYRNERRCHEQGNAPVAAQAGTMAAGLLLSVLLVPATLAAVSLTANFALHVIAERYEARAWQEQVADQDVMANDPVKIAHNRDGNSRRTPTEAIAATRSEYHFH